MIRTIRTLVCLVVFSLAVTNAMVLASEAAPSTQSAQQIVSDMATSFEAKHISSRPLVIQFEVQPGPQLITVRLDGTGKAAAAPGRDPNPSFTCKTDYETLKKMYDGEINALTAGAKANWTDHAPLDIDIPDGEKLTPELMKDIVMVGQRFLNRSIPEMVRFGIDHSRVVHGGHVTSLFYDQGLRSAFYTLQKGDRLNEAADQNPFPQAFIILRGEGSAQIGGSSIKIKAGEAYYIPSGSQHNLWTDGEQGLDLIWIAWGRGA